MAKNIRAVIFDYGNVLCPMPPPPAFENLARIAGIPPDSFIKSLWRYRLDYDRGTLNGTAYWQQVAQENGKQFSDLQVNNLMEADFALWIHPSPVMVGWARKLRWGGLKTSILSNMPRDFSSYLRSTAEWLHDFEVKIFSGELGMVKPDAGIYQACIEGLAVHPEEALFIDDVAVNVEAAHELGINAVKFESIAQLAQDVVRFKFTGPMGDVADLIVPGS